MKPAVHNHIRSARKQAGATLLEMAMVIGIIAVISVAAVTAYNSSSEGRRITDATRDLGTLVGGVRNMFAAQGSYDGVSNQAVIKAGFLKNSMHNGSTSIHHPWNDASVTVEEAAGASPKRTFRVTFTGVPENACMQLSANTIGNAVGIKIGTTAVTNVGLIASSCSGDSNTIEWTFD